MEAKDYLPFAIVGGGALLAYLLIKPQPYTVVNPPAPQKASDSEKLQAVVALSQLAVERERVALERERARWEYAATVEAAKAQAEYERRARQIEAELEARRIQAEKEVQQKAADAQFWGTFWSGLFGLVGSGLAIIAGLSDEALYNRLPYPPYIGDGGQLKALSRRR